MKFKFRIGTVLYEQVTLEELHKIFDQEAQRIENAKSVVSSH